MKTWSAIVALVIAAVAGINVVRLSSRVPPPPRGPAPPAPDVVIRQEERFAGVKTALQKHHVPVTVGYVTDPTMAADSNAAQDYFLAQFVLAPWVLDSKYHDCDWAVVNARDRFVPPGFKIVEDFGRGVLVVQKIAR